MSNTYINGIGCISAQKTFDSVFLDDFVVNEQINVLPVQSPVYKDYIPPAAIRRMSKGVKNGTVASTMAMKESGIEMPDAIITGTGMGCIEDSDKFLKAIIDNNEEFLTPTSFIQSTHNTVGAQIALGLQCKAYNFTYVNGAVSFESALLDAKLKIDEHDASSILVGGIDEMNDYTASIYKLAGIIKQDNEAPYSILNSQTKGAIYSEGATFFVIEDKMKASTYAQVSDVDIINRLEINEVELRTKGFLTANGLQTSDIDAVILGFNGDVPFDGYYRALSENSFLNTPQVYYKHLSGEYNTASAFGLWAGANILKTQHIPAILKVNQLERSVYNKVLIYNQYRGIDHSFTLISKCQDTR